MKNGIKSRTKNSCIRLLKATAARSCIRINVHLTQEQTSMLALALSAYPGQLKPRKNAFIPEANSDGSLRRLQLHQKVLIRGLAPQAQATHPPERMSTLCDFESFQNFDWDKRDSYTAISAVKHSLAHQLTFC